MQAPGVTEWRLSRGTIRVQTTETLARLKIQIGLNVFALASTLAGVPDGLQVVGATWDLKTGDLVLFARKAEP